MKLPTCNLIGEEDIKEKLDNLKGKEKKLFLKSIELIKLIENGIDISYQDLLNEEVEHIKSICEDKENYEVLMVIKKIIDQRNSIKIGDLVDFCGSPFIVINRNDRELDIQQNFSIGLIYNEVDISEVKIITN